MKLHMAIDFFDEMIPMAWDRERLSKYMKMNADMGVERIDWIFHCGKEDGFWTSTGLPWEKNYIDTFDNLGNPYLKAAVEEAHKFGMEVFAVYKPFELSCQFFSLRDKLRSDNPLQHGLNFAKENTSLMMQRRSLEKLPASQIILNSADKLDAEHKFQLWESNDNWNYKKVGAPVSPESDGHTVSFDVSNLKSKHFAIESLSEGTVSNKVGSIIEVKTKDGKDVQHSLGLVPRKYYKPIQEYHLKREFDTGEGFSTEGFYLDHYPNIPSAVEKCTDKIFNFSENDQNVIGVSLELNEYVPGAPEPSEPEVVSFWQKMIEKALDCGVDGVDIRIMNHNTVIDWEEYGFNQPAVDEYIKRYGVDPRTEAFYMENWQRLRGEFYTAFLEKAADQIKKAGRKVCVHVADMIFDFPQKAGMMNIHWNWREWLEKGIPDEVTVKPLYHNNAFCEEAVELMNSCKDKNIPISVCPFFHAVPDMKDYLDKTEQAGFDAFVTYEAASLWLSEKDSFLEINPEVLKIIQNKFQG